MGDKGDAWLSSLVEERHPLKQGLKQQLSIHLPPVKQGLKL